MGDAGCIRLFEFLSSPAGLHCRDSLTELFLTKNEIGAHGLLAVAAFLRGNTVLRELCLSGVGVYLLVSFLADSCLCTLEPSDHRSGCYRRVCDRAQFVPFMHAANPSQQFLGRLIRPSLPPSA